MHNMFWKLKVTDLKIMLFGIKLSTHSVVFDVSY